MSAPQDQLAEALGETAAPWRRRDLLRQLDLGSLDVQALLDCARQRREGDPEAARRIARSAFLVAKVARNQDALLSAGRLLAQTHIVLGQPVQALQRLAAIRPSTSMAAGVALAAETAQTLMLLARFEEAIRVLHDAEASLPRRGAASFRARLAVIEGFVRAGRGESAEALACYERGRALLARLGMRRALPQIDINRATALTNLEEYDRAERLYARGGRALERQGASLLAMQAGYNHAYLRFARGYFHDALERFRDLRPRFAAANDKRHVAMCDLDEAEISIHMNLPAHAAELAARAARALEALGLPAEVARAEFFWAVAARRLGRAREAMGRLERAEQTFRSLENVMWWGICLHRLAEIDAELGATGRAAARAAKAARRLRACGLRERAGYADVLVASIEFRAGEADGAERRLRDLLGDIEDLRLPWLRCEIHHLLARIHESKGDLHAAARHVLRATGLLERHRVAVPPDEYMAAFLTGKAALFEDATRVVLDRGGPAASVRAFELAEQARGRALLDLLRHHPRRRDRRRTSALSREATRLEREIDGLSSRMPALDRGARAEDADRRALQATRREERLAGCLDRLAALDPGGVRLRRRAAPRFRDVAENLPADETLIEYFVTRNELITFVVQGGQLDVHRRPLEDRELTGLLERASFQLDRPNVFDRFDERFAAVLTRSARAALEALHDLLLAPVRDTLKTRRVVIVPHGDLNGVPFHALETGGRPLLLDHEVIQAPSASIYLHGRSAPQRASHTALLLGVPDAAAPHIRREIEGLARRIPGSRAFVGREATEATLRRYGRRARLIHIAAHGRFQHDEPMDSGIKLADGWLTIPRIANLSVRPELLVLSGCGTGRASVTEGGELFGLVRGFLMAGAAALLTSLWPIPDSQTAVFMDAFYDAWIAGSSPAAALRSATLGLREREPHPFHWAPFVLMGRGT